MYREVSVIEVRELLRAWLSGVGLRTVATRAGVDRKTARRYVDAALAEGLDRDGGADQLCDELIGAVVAAVRPDRPQGYGSAWEALCTNHDRINDWVKDGLTAVDQRLQGLGERQPHEHVPRIHRGEDQRMHHPAAARIGATVPIVDGEPGVAMMVSS
jgi:hypothetical protein